LIFEYIFGNVNKKQQLPKQFVRALIDTAKIDKVKKQFTVVFATETPVFRRGWEENFMEILSCKKENIRAERMEAGVVPLLDNHDVYTGVQKQYGSLISYEIVDNECRGVIQFSTRAELQGYWDDIEAGIIKGISARYIPWEYSREVTENKELPNYRAIDWEVTEISLAPVPADFNSSVRSEEKADTYEIQIRNFSNKNSETNMETKVEGQQPATQQRNEGGAPVVTPIVTVNEDQIRAQAATAERQRISSIRTAVRTANLEDTVAEELIESNVTIDVARSTIFEKMAAKQSTPNVRQQSNAGNPVVIADEGDAIRTAMQNVILHRAEPGTKLEGKAVEMRGMKLFDMARYMLELKGEKPFGFSQNETVARAISTTDFPDLLTSTLGVQLRKYFAAYNSGSWKKIANRTTVSDFREKTGVQVDGSVNFEKIAEGGEYKSTKFMQNSKATISVDTYGRMIKITRQAIINDNLDVFSKIPKFIAQGANNMQAKMVWDLILENAKTPDGKAIFHADHSNLAGAGAISEATLNAAIVAMMKQTSPAGEELMLSPKYLIVPVELQTAAQKILTGIIASTTGDVNVFAKAFELISEIRASRKSATAWYMAADPSTVEGLEYAYLDGEEGVYTESQTNFNDDSIDTKARIEFGVAAWEYRGWYKNPGA